MEKTSKDVKWTSIQVTGAVWFKVSTKKLFISPDEMHISHKLSIGPYRNIGLYSHYDHIINC